MPNSLRIIIALLIAAGAPRVTAAQSCVLSGATSTNSDIAGPLKLEPVAITTGPTNTRVVPFIVSTNDGLCRVHISPRAERGQFRVALRGAIPPGAGATVLVHLRSLDTKALSVSTDTVPVRDSEVAALTAAIAPLTREAREYSVAFVATSATGTEVAFPIRLLWTPDPEIEVRSHNSGCGESLCLYTNVKQNIDVVGHDVSEIDPVQAIVVKQRDNAATTLVPNCCRLEAGREGRYFQLNPQSVTTVGYEIEFQLATPRIRLADGKFQIRTGHLVTATARISDPPPAALDIEYAESTSGNEKLQVLRGASTGLRVRIVSPKRTDLTQKFASGAKYQLREAFAGASGKSVAELYVDEVTTAAALGTLIPLAPTQEKSGRDAKPLVGFWTGDTDLKLRVQLTVLPPTDVQRTFVRRAGKPDELGAIVHPLDTATLRLEGPGVGYLSTGEFEHNAVKFLPANGGKRFAEVRFAVTRNARPVEELVLHDIDGGDVTVPITVLPAQRPRKRLDFAVIAYRDGSDRRTLSLAFNDQDVATNRTASGRNTAQSRELAAPPRPRARGGQSAPATRHSASSLRDVTIRFDANQIDGADSLFGVQYVRVTAQLLDPNGTERGRQEKCVAIVPPPVGMRPYPVNGNCERLRSGELPLSDLLGGPAQRATAKSEMRITVQHDQAQYPDDDIDRVRSVTIRKSGRFILEPRLELPGPLIALQRGRMSPGLTYGGALFSVQPAWRNKFFGAVNNAHAIGVQLGFVVGTVPAGQAVSNKLASELSFTSGLGYTFRNMVGDVALSFYSGAVFPVDGRGFRRRDAYAVFRPGFSLPIPTTRPGGS